MSIFYVLMALCLSGGTLAQFVTNGDCPNVEVQQNLNMSRLAGTWYEQARFFNPYELTTNCGRFYFMGFPDNTGRLVTSVRSVFTGVERIYETEVLTPDPQEPAKVLIKIPLSPVEGYNNLWVLGTDYDNWIVLFSCTTVGNRNLQYAWVASRVPVPDDSLLARAKALLLRNKIAAWVLQKVGQKRCPM